MKCLVKSIIAGIMIGIGGTIYLSVENKVVGSILFAIGLFAIVVYGFNLYTGKIGYLVTNFNFKYIKELIITLMGNFIGTFFVGFILRYTRIYSLISEKAKALVDIKLDDTIISILILSFFCGILMYFAVNSYKELKDVGGYIAVFLGVIVFILCGFEHCVANMYYFSVSSSWCLNSFLYLLVMILGNSLGGMLIPLCDRIIKK
ncbi:MAG: formate/nitrite transporter family protein [Bacilli bacterium]